MLKISCVALAMLCIILFIIAIIALSNPNYKLNKKDLFAVIVLSVLLFIITIIIYNIF